MAKDDYDAVVYRVLVYLYGCFRRKIIFDDEIFNKAVSKYAESEEYFHSVLRKMQDDRLICGLVFKKIGGGEYLLFSDLREAEITSDGIHYLKENSRMKKMRDTMRGVCDVISSLAEILLKGM